LVEGIAVVAETYEETKKILEASYGDKSRITEAHLDYLEDVTPNKYATPEALNSTYIDCNRRIQTLRALGEDVNGYGRVLGPKILRAFPDNICGQWNVHTKREGISEGDILQLMNFLGEEADGALTTQKKRGESSSLCGYTSTDATSRTSQILMTSMEGHSRTWTVLCILRFAQPLGTVLQKVNWRHRNNRETKESKPKLPLPQQRAYRLKLRE